jgi:hypothetical protein
MTRAEKIIKFAEKNKQLKLDLEKLFKDILFQTHHMTNHHGDSNVLSQMAIQDGISSWSIEDKIRVFAEENGIDVS